MVDLLSKIEGAVEPIMSDETNSLSKEYLNYFNDKISNEDINGFKGSELSLELSVIESFVNGIENILLEK